MTEEREALAARLRAALADEPSTVEKPMFGTRAFLVHDRLVACARRDGGLLVRVADDRHDELVARPGAAQAEMGAGRSMGRGWLDVDAEAVTGEALVFWLGAALERHGVEDAAPR